MSAGAIAKVEHPAPFFMLETLITSRTRVKLLLKFFLNSGSSSYLRGLESEFGESTNAIRLELNRFEKAGLLSTSTSGNKKIFRANTSHPLFKDIHNLLLKYIGFDQIVDKVVNKLGDVKMVFITGDFARGLDSNIMDLTFIGDDIDKEYLMKLIDKSEGLIKRKIKYLVYTTKEFSKEYSNGTNKEEMLLLWKA